MRRPVEYHEGPDAARRFETLMGRILSTPKAAPAPSSPKTKKPVRKKR
jgi:hypothetical protein